MNNTEHIIKSCGFSEEMQTHLLDCDLSEKTVINIILGAPIPLAQKRDLLESMLASGDKKVSEVSLCIDEIDKAFEAIESKSDAIFTLFECYYDDFSTMRETKEFSKPFFSYHDVSNYIKKMVEEDTACLKEGDDYTYWAEVIKWVPCSDDMREDYLYVFVGKEIYYFKRFGNDSFDGYINAHDLHLPIPFKTGDIITLNCVPFAPIKHAVIIDVGINFRLEKNLFFLFREKNGFKGKNEWKTGKIEHGCGWSHYCPLLSPFYRLSKFEGDLPENEGWMNV